MSKLEGKYILPADDDYLVADVLIDDGALTLLNTTLDFARNVTVTVTDGNASISAGTITVVGTDDRGNALTESFSLVTAGVKTGTKMFKTITSATVADIEGEGEGDNAKVGIGGTVQVFEQVGEFGAIIIGETAAGAITITDQDSNGSRHTIGIIKASIAEGEYRFDCSVSKGLRLVLAGASKVSVTFARSTFN